jgi:hypothetical protein
MQVLCGISELRMKACVKLVVVPWLMNAKVEVRFTNITLSQDYKLLSGIIETTYDPTESGIDNLDDYIDAFSGGYGVGNVVTGFSFSAMSPASTPLIMEEAIGDIALSRHYS